MTVVLITSIFLDDYFAYPLDGMVDSIGSSSYLGQFVDCEPVRGSNTTTDDKYDDKCHTGLAFLDSANSCPLGI